MATGRTYVIFDGDNDMWAYAFMKGWKVNERVEFEFVDAHDLGSMTSNAQNEQYVKSELRKRMEKSSQVIVLVGNSTKNLRKFVPWEIGLALDLDLPVIVVNLNDKRSCDMELCPVALRTTYSVHIPFRRAIIKLALDNFLADYRRRDESISGPLYYKKEVYDGLDL